MPWSATVVTKARWASSPASAMPVVSSSSPPESHGVGSGSSEMWTQRTGASAACSPAASSRPIPSTRPRTVSMGSVVHHAIPGFAEHRTQDRLDVAELLAVRHERRGELDDGVAAVVGAADQPAAVELAGHEPAQELLRLLVAEALLGVLVLDE